VDLETLAPQGADSREKAPRIVPEDQNLAWHPERDLTAPRVPPGVPRAAVARQSRAP
jgi:hypothetical protein